MPKIRDITGQKFGMLTPLKHIGAKPDGRAIWLCKCDCGNLKEIASRGIIQGNIISCGCYRKRNGETTRLCQIWRNMKKRCYDQTSIDYKNYGALGITICDEWLIYWNFKEWALTNGYADNLTIDRKDNKLGYSPDNCTFTTTLEQSQNRRSSQPNPISGYKNVIFCNDKANKPWKVQFRYNRQNHFVGYFETPELANEALLLYKSTFNK